MMVKCYGYNSVKHGMDFAQDLKMGQYMKIPPRVLFVGQIYSSILATAVQAGGQSARARRHDPPPLFFFVFCLCFSQNLTTLLVLRWMIGNIPDLCSPNNSQRFTCAGAKVYYNGSLIWGTIGPQRMFQAGQVYAALPYFFLVGPACTVLVYCLYRRYPATWLRYVNVPIFFNAAGNIPPANTTQYSLWFLFGFLFNWHVRRRAFAWWKRYNYLLQAAMDTGTALATVLVFFALSYTGTTLRWWGNTVGSDTDDANAVPWLTVPEGGYFGKGPGQF